MKTKKQQLEHFESFCKEHFGSSSMNDLRIMLVDDCGEVIFKNDSVESLKKLLHDIYEMGFIDGSKFLP